MDKILIKRGTKEKLEKSSPLSQGELFLARDEERLYVGGPRGNISLPTQKEVDEKHQQVTTQLDQIEKEVDEKHQQVTTQLDQIEKEVDEKHQEVITQLVQIEKDLDEKATKTELQQVSLAYKESYDTLDDLKKAYPFGDVYNHVVLADGMIYTYAKGQWISTGVEATGAIEFMKAYEDLKVLGVGGRNLIPNSKKIIVNPDGKDTNALAIIELTEIIPAGTPFTFQTNYKFLAGESETIRFFFRRTDKTGAVLFEPSIDSDHGYIEYTNNGHVNDIQYIYVYAGTLGKTKGNIVEFTKLKLEKGTTATDWTPAPEDIDAHPFVVELAETAFRSKQNFEFMHVFTEENEEWVIDE